MKKVVALLLLINSLYGAEAQRLADRNTIGWYAYTGNFKVSNKFSINTEYQWRRIDLIQNWQQGLYRTGLNYALNKNVNIIAGYAYAYTHTYGDFPAAFNFPEHRIYEQLFVKNPLGPVLLTHRFMLEQRFVGKVTMPANEKITDYNYVNRMRYRIRTQIPLHNSSALKKPWSLIVQDEIFVGFGKNVGANIFDQNRIGLLLNYKLSDPVQLEAGYINQTVQQGGYVNNLPVFQYNNGFVIGLNINADLRKKKASSSD